MKQTFKPGDYVQFLSIDSLLEVLNKENHSYPYKNAFCKLQNQQYYVKEVINNRYLVLEGLSDKYGAWGYGHYGQFPYKIKKSYVRLIDMKDDDVIKPLFGSQVYCNAV